jgi:hypothetical protein
MEIGISELSNAISKANCSSDVLDAQCIVSQIEFLKYILEDVKDERNEHVSIDNRYSYPGHSKAIDGLLNILSLMESKLASK